MKILIMDRSLIIAGGGKLEGRRKMLAVLGGMGRKM